MRLNSDEQEEIFDNEASRIWRVVKPHDAVPMSAHIHDGHAYTIVAVERVSRDEIMRGPRSYRPAKKLLDAHPNVKALWAITCVHRRHSLDDTPQLLRHTGHGADFTSSPSRAMRGDADPGEAPT